MQQNVSEMERLASIAIGSLALGRGLFSSKSRLTRLGQTVGGASLVWRGLSGHCPVYEKLGKSTLAKPERLEKTILINRPLDSVTSVLGEGDPVWQSSSTVFPMTAGNHLWDLRLEDYGDSKRTLIHAELAGPEQPQIKGRLQIAIVKQALDTELRKLKALVEAGEYPTIEGQPHGQRSKLGKAVEQISESIQDKAKESIPAIAQQPMEAYL